MSTVTDTKPVQTPKVVVGAETATVSLSEHSAQFADKVKRHMQPPDIWSDSRPSLKATWMWALHGQHMPGEDTARRVTRAGAFVTIPFRALFLWLDWIVERPSRLMTLLVFIGSIVLVAVFA